MLDKQKSTVLIYESETLDDSQIPHVSLSNHTSSGSPVADTMNVVTTNGQQYRSTEGSHQGYTGSFSVSSTANKDSDDAQKISGELTTDCSCCSFVTDVVAKLYHLWSVNFHYRPEMDPYSFMI